MGYFADTFPIILEAKKPSDETGWDAFGGAMQDTMMSMGCLDAGAGQIFSSPHLLEYIDSNGKFHSGSSAYACAMTDYFNEYYKKHKVSGALNRLKDNGADKEFKSKCKAANSKEEYDLNKALGLRYKKK
jgi:hypothetical protein